MSRRLPNGLLRPYLADLLDGYTEAARLRAQGLDVDLGHADTAVLGRAVADQREARHQGHGQYKDHEPELSPEFLAKLERVALEREHHVSKALDHPPDQVRNQGQVSTSPTPAPQTAPERTAKSTAEDSDISNESDKDHGHPSPATAVVLEKPGSDKRDDPDLRQIRQRPWRRSSPGCPTRVGNRPTATSGTPGSTGGI